MIVPWELTLRICPIRDKHSDARRKIFQMYPNSQCLVSLYKIKILSSVVSYLTSCKPHEIKLRLRKKYFSSILHEKLEPGCQCIYTWQKLCYAAWWMGKLSVSNYPYHLVNNSYSNWYLFYIYCVSSSMLDALLMLYDAHTNSLRAIMTPVLLNFETEKGNKLPEVRAQKLLESGFEPGWCDFGCPCSWL